MGFDRYKNSKAAYYLLNLLRGLVPRSICRRRLYGILARLENRYDRSYILERVEYYNKLVAPCLLPDESPRIGDMRRKGHNSVYFFDTVQYLRYFATNLRWQYLFGDITYVPDQPSIVKSRPIVGDNANSVLLNLDKVRHFSFLNDPISFNDKENRAIFRGHIINKPHRIRFMEMYFGHPICDCGNISPFPELPTEWTVTPISIKSHLRYKFIITLEGNDVASNLKWVMSSNSLAVMPRPVYETWFMEGQLVPNVHYIEIRPDFSDLEERINHYATHPSEAQAIIRNAHEYVQQFKHRRRERLISLLVLQKYFNQTEQLPL